MRLARSRRPGTASVISRRRAFVLAALVGVIATGAAVAVMQGGTTAGGRDHVRAVLDGQPINVGDIARYSCHDRDYPLIRCFHSEAEADVDLGGDIR